MTPPKLLAVRKDGLNMAVCLDAAMNARGLIKEFDRLYGTNLSMKGNGLALMIDEATGKQHADMGAFIDFVYEYIFLRCGDCSEPDSRAKK